MDCSTFTRSTAALLAGLAVLIAGSTVWLGALLIATAYGIEAPPILVTASGISIVGAAGGWVTASVAAYKPIVHGLSLAAFVVLVAWLLDATVFEADHYGTAEAVSYIAGAGVSVGALAKRRLRQKSLKTA